jgi:uncharacterized membrane protein (DUF2068 family)
MRPGSLTFLTPHVVARGRAAVNGALAHLSTNDSTNDSSADSVETTHFSSEPVPDVPRDSSSRQSSRQRTGDEAAVRPYPAESTIAAVRRERGLLVIIVYKFVKGVLWLIFAATILVFMRMGLGNHLLGLAHHLRLHAHPWSLALADVVTRASSRRGLWTITVALLADGSLTLVEGWSLLHGRWWGPWLVVVATGSLLPFEVVALVRHRHVVRAVVFLVNVAIVVYLARKALREHRLRRLERRDGGSASRPPGALPRASAD